MLELTLALLLAMLAAVFAADRFAERSREVMVEGHAAWMAALHQAALTYIELHATSLAQHGAAAPIDGVADVLAPTLPELKAAGLLAPGFPMQGARGLGGRVRLVLGDACPLEACRIEALVYSDVPLGKDASRSHRPAMVAHWLAAASGQGGAVMPFRSEVVSGAAFVFPNPPDASLPPLPVGTVALAVTAEQLESLAYLKVRDSRNPNFQGPASIAGNLSTEGALLVREHIRIESQAFAQTPCAVEGAVVRERYGGLLVCRGGQWSSAGGSGGGGYSINTLAGCVAAAANPITGDCSCPSQYVPVRIADSTSAIPSEGRTRGYLCVG